MDKITQESGIAELKTALLEAGFSEETAAAFESKYYIVTSF